MNIPFELQKIQQDIDTLILSTPTGKTREKLTQININVLNLLDKIEEQKLNSTLKLGDQQ
jgi:hypothetical protein